MAAEKTQTETQTHKEKVDKFYNEERVPVFIRRPEGVKDNACTITLNGVNYQILYNTEVMVPRCVALIVEESERNIISADESARKMSGVKSLGEV